MNPLLKKAIAAVAVKEAIEKVQEMRRPKPSLWSRISPLAFVAAIGGALFYLNKSGKLSPMIDQVKGKSGSGSSSHGSNGSASGSGGANSWDGGSSSTAPSAPTPTPTNV